MARRDPNSLSLLLRRGLQYAVPPATPASSSSSTTAPPDHASEGVNATTSSGKGSKCAAMTQPVEVRDRLRSSSRDRVPLQPREVQAKMSYSSERSEAARRREESIRKRRDLHREKAKELQEIIARASPRVREPTNDTPSQTLRKQYQTHHLQKQRLLDSSSRDRLHESHQNMRVASTKVCQDTAMRCQGARARSPLKNEQGLSSRTRLLRQTQKTIVRHDLEHENVQCRSARKYGLQHSASERRFLAPRIDSGIDRAPAKHSHASAVLQHSASEPKMPLMATEPLDGNVQPSSEIHEPPFQQVWEAIEDAMLSLSDDAQKEKVISRVEKLLELMAEQCERSLRSYARAEELASLLKNVEQQIGDHGNLPRDAYAELLAIRRNLHEDRDSALAEAAEAERLARNYERASTSAIARERTLSRKPQAQKLEYNSTSSAHAQASLLVGSQPPCAALLASMSLGLLHTAQQQIQDGGNERTSFLERTPYGYDGDIGSFQCG